MQYTTAFVLAVASLAAAQSTTSSSAAAATSGSSQSGCGTAIDAIITNCIASTSIRVSACDSQDWNCLCDNQRAVLTCYDNCPSSPDRFGVEQTEVSYCNAAKAYGSSSSTSSRATSSGSSTSGSSTATATDSSATETDSSSTTSTRSSSASSASSAAASATGDSGANVVMPAGGILAAVFGLAAML